MLGLSSLIFKWFCSGKKFYQTLHWVIILFITESDNLFQLEWLLQSCQASWAFTPRTDGQWKEGDSAWSCYSDKLQTIHLCAQLKFFLLPPSPLSLHKNPSLCYLFCPFRKNISLIWETGLIEQVGSSFQDFALFSLKLEKASDSHRRKPEQLNVQTGTGSL